MRVLPAGPDLIPGNDLTRPRVPYGLTAMHRPVIYISQILGWADVFHTQTGRWPKKDDGPIDGPLNLSWHRWTTPWCTACAVCGPADPWRGCWKSTAASATSTTCPS